MLRTWAWAAIVGVLLSTSRPGIAADAEDLIAQGIKLRKDGRDQEAFPLFQQAAKQQTTPRAIAQLGTCEQALGLWVGAESHIEEALKHPQDMWIQKNEAPLRAALAYVQQRLGSIDVWGSPPGARVSIDGEFLGTLPMKQRARAAVGQRAITIDALGFLSESRTIEVRSGALVREHVALRSIAAPLPASPAAPAKGSLNLPAAALLSTKSRENVPPIPAEDSERHIHKRWWFWAIAGTLAVAAGGSVYLLATRNDTCQAPMGGTCSTF